MEDKRGTENQRELITALVIHYNNGDSIYETIDSVLAQTYPRIELIVSDDCSECFSVEEISQYIEARKRSNIEKVLVRQNSRNLGTVRHLEGIFEESTGEIILLIAADDVWHDEEVFEAFAKRFDELGPDAEFITSQVEMCDETLENVQELFVKPAVSLALTTGDMQTLRNMEAIAPVLPGPGSAFRRSYREIIGQLSDTYTIVEDWSSHLRWLMMGEKVYYLDRVTLKHRAGGISHSSRDWPEHHFAYRSDIAQLYDKEIKGKESLLGPSAREKAKEMGERNKMRCESLKSKISVIAPLVELNDKECRAVVESILLQTNMNYEIVFGCTHDQIDKVINLTNETYVIKKNIRRIRIVECADGTEAKSRLESYAQGDYSIYIPKGKQLKDDDALLVAVSQAQKASDMHSIVDAVLAPIDLGSIQKGSIKKKKGYRSLIDFAIPEKMQFNLLLIVASLLALCLLQNNSTFGSTAVFVVACLSSIVLSVMFLLRLCIFIGDKLLHE